MKSLEEVFDIEVLKREVEQYAGMFTGIGKESEYYDRFNNEYSVIICTLASEYNGHNIPGIILDIFGSTPWEVDVGLS